MFARHAVLLRQSRQLPRLQAQIPAQAKAASASTKAARASIPKAGSSSSSSSPSSTTSSVQSSAVSAGANVANSAAPTPALRNRKLTPAAKAKAQASASRALREQLAAINDEGVSAGRASKNAAAAVAAAASTAPPALRDGLSTSGLPSEGDAAASISPGGVGGGGAAAAVALEAPRRLYDAYAYATAESYDLEKLVASARLPPGWQYLEDSEVIYIPAWPPQSAAAAAAAAAANTSSSSSSLSSPSPQGEIFIFRSGSYVTWGLSSEQSRRFLRLVIQGRPNVKGQTAEVDTYGEIGDETMEYVIAEDQITRVVGDVMVIGQAPRMEPDDEFDPDLVVEEQHQEGEVAVNGEEESTVWSPLLARLAFSQGLSRSARLSVQEAALSTYLEEVSAIPGRLEKEGSVPLHRKEIIRKMGTLLKLRQRANLDSENFLDDPEMYWENWKVEHHYDSICLALDIESRFKAYNEKLDHGENLLGVLRALLTEASTHRMELIIIYLIAFEVVLALISHGYVPSPRQVWNLLTGRGMLSEPDEEGKDVSSDQHHHLHPPNEQVMLSSLRRLLLSQGRTDEAPIPSESFTANTARLV